jgi:ribose 5-phosphate isomerase B
LDRDSRTTHPLEAWSKVYRIGIAADHGGFVLKAEIVRGLRAAGCRVVDFGADFLDPTDDYPDCVAPLARAVANGQVLRGLAICGSGVGTCIASNKIAGVRAALVTECFSAHQGVEDDDMNIMCLGALVTGTALAWDLVKTYLSAQYSAEERFRRRLEKVARLEIAIDTRRFSVETGLEPDG